MFSTYHWDSNRLKNKKILKTQFYESQYVGINQLFDRNQFGVTNDLL